MGKRIHGGDPKISKEKTRGQEKNIKRGELVLNLSPLADPL